MSIEKLEDEPEAPRTEGDDKQSAANKNKLWLTIFTIIIGLIGTLVVGYWQFVYKRTPDQQKPISFTGRVTDAVNGKPIYKAKISIEEDQEVPQIEYTDSEGIFHLKFRASTTSGRIRVESNGYEALDRNISLSRTGIEVIPLKPINQRDGQEPTLTPTTAPTSSPAKTKDISNNSLIKKRSNTNARSKTYREEAYEDLYSRRP